MSEPQTAGIPSVAQRIYDAMHEMSSAEDATFDALLAAFRVAHDQPDTWPLTDMTFDDYDTSFEFKGVRDDWEPSADGLAKCWAMGFARCWICYKDGSEQYHSPMSRGPRRQVAPPLADKSVV